MAINLSKVRFHYPETPNQLVLDIPDWSVADGERVFVHGQSGSGKSTLLNVLNGLLPVTAGQVTVLGKNLNAMSSLERDQFRADQIGCVFQQFNLIPYLNAIENIDLAHQFSRAKTTVDASQLLTTLNLAPKDWQVPVRTLSVGQQQRVAIARALVNQPQLLIADEPTSSLDKQNCDAFMAQLMESVAAHNTTLLFVSHDLSLSSYFTQTVALEEINHIAEAHHV